MPTNAPRADWRLVLIRASATALLLIAAAPRASAQADSGGLATATVSAVQAPEGTSAAIAASIGYRLNRTLSVGVELTVIPDFAPGEAASCACIAPAELPPSIASSLIYPPPTFRVDSNDGRAVIFTGNLRLTVPTRSPRLSPYLVAGAGVGNVREEVSYAFDFEPIFPAGFPLPLPRTIVFPSIQQSIARSTTDVAITMGGGISVAMGNQWSIDADARYMAILGNRDLQMGRFGAGVSYRF